MKEIAESLGYVFRYKGCVCNGSPLNYRKTIAGYDHRLVIYNGRGIWMLIKGSDVVLRGNSSNMLQSLTEYENLQLH